MGDKRGQTEGLVKDQKNLVQGKPKNSSILKNCEQPTVLVTNHMKQDWKSSIVLSYLEASSVFMGRHC